MCVCPCGVVQASGFATSKGISFLEVKLQLMLCYVTNLAFYMLLKAEGRPVKDHPVLDQILRTRYATSPSHASRLQPACSMCLLPTHLMYQGHAGAHAALGCQTAVSNRPLAQVIKGLRHVRRISHIWCLAQQLLPRAHRWAATKQGPPRRCQAKPECIGAPRCWCRCGRQWRSRTRW